MGAIVTFAQRRKSLVMTGVAVAAEAGVAAAVIPAVADSGSMGKDSSASAGHPGHGTSPSRCRAALSPATAEAPSSPPA